MSIANTTLLNAAVEVATSAVMPSPRKSMGAMYPDKGPVLFHSKITGTGALTATINIYGSIDGTTATGELVQTHTMSGTTSDIVADSVSGLWPYFYADLTAISGTGAAVTTTMVG
jgi:hypothetical protein